MGSGISIFRRSFRSSKCKTEARLAMARIKLLRNRRETQVRQMRRDVAMLLDSHQESTARIRVEHVIREQNIMAANEIIELFCELIVVRLPIIAKQRDCPADLKEGISSLIFAAPRCSDIPELLRLCDIFEKKYGKDFVSAATDLRPESGVNRTLIEKLSVRTPSSEIKLKIMKEIAKEYQIEWDTTESEHVLLKPSEELLDGPRSFVSASSMPVMRATNPLQGAHPNRAECRSPIDRETFVAQFKDSASAAHAAAKLAEKAVAAAHTAAYLAKRDSQQGDRKASFGTMANGLESSQFKKEDGLGSSSATSCQFFVLDDHLAKECELPRTIYSSQNSNRILSDDEIDPAADLDAKHIHRRCSYNVRAVPSDIKFDESDGSDSECDDHVETQRHSEGGHLAPRRPPPSLPPSLSHQPSSSKRDPVSHVHPKLPDYEELTARFEALRRRRS